jgi:hypothetical protein
MTKEVGEITSKMEENMSSPMRTLQGFMDQIFIKWLAKGILRILRRWKEEVMKKLLEASKEGLERLLFFLWKFWEIIVEVLEALKEKLWEWGL